MEKWIHLPIIDTEPFSDASDFIWGGVFEGKPTGGAWSETEEDYHINEKELLVIFDTLKSFKFDFPGKHIKTFSDNAAALIKIGACKNHVSNKRAQQIWGFCQQNHM